MTEFASQQRKSAPEICFNASASRVVTLTDEGAHSQKYMKSAQTFLQELSEIGLSRAALSPAPVSGVRL